MKAKESKLQKRIRELGIDKAAKRWGVSVRQVQSWFYGARRPGTDAGLSILDKERGTLGVKDIFG